jgi:hypothetical protein
MKALEFFVLTDNDLKEHLEKDEFNTFKFLLENIFYIEVKKEKNIRNLSTDSLYNVHSCKVFDLSTGACKLMDISKQDYELLKGVVCE